MSPNYTTSETTALLSPSAANLRQRRDDEVESLLSSHLSKEERALHSSPVGERLPYNDYTTIDWLHELVKDSVRLRHLHSTYSHDGVRGRVVKWWDKAQGWVAAALIGVLTACVAFVVDVAVSLIADWKEGYCGRNLLLDKGTCCNRELRPNGVRLLGAIDEDGCEAWRSWGEGSWARTYVVYVAFALLFGLVAGNVTMLTRTKLPAVDDELEDDASGGTGTFPGKDKQNAGGKMMYMAAGSGIPEIKTILSGFVIPHFLDLKVLLVKAIGATFAVSTGMCLGKEGPFVHISTCVGYIVANWFPKYGKNGKKLREMLSVACSAGLSVAFGAPIGGVLFSYEVSRIDCHIVPVANAFIGNQHILPAPGPLEILSLLHGCGSDTETAQSDRYRKARPLRDQLRNQL